MADFSQGELNWGDANRTPASKQQPATAANSPEIQKPTKLAAPLSVLQVTMKIKRLMEYQVGRIWVQGEISNWKEASSGHIYFSLKDEKATLNAVMWRSKASRLNFKAGNGIAVECRGQIDVYAQRGSYQLVVDSIAPQGLGVLLAAIEATKKRLAADGLLNENLKRSLPQTPNRVGFVTSQTGAALHDMLQVSQQRAPGVHILLSPATVQGDQAPKSIVNALDLLYQQCENSKIDVIIIGRGGGSLEDLMAFNDEQVCRKIAASPVPIVSAVGHEVDHSLSDLVADLRAATPSHAAELVFPDKAVLSHKLIHLQERLQRLTDICLSHNEARLLKIMARLKTPESLLNQARLQLDEQNHQLQMNLHHLLNQKKSALSLLQNKLVSHHPQEKVYRHKQSLAHNSLQLQQKIRQTLVVKQKQLESLCERLQLLSPLSVLERGYAIVQDETGQVVRNANDVKTDQHLKIILHEGKLNTKVIKPKEES